MGAIWPWDRATILRSHGRIVTMKEASSERGRREPQGIDQKKRYEHQIHNAFRPPTIEEASPCDSRCCSFHARWHLLSTDNKRLETHNNE